MMNSEATARRRYTLASRIVNSTRAYLRIGSVFANLAAIDVGGVEAPFSYSRSMRYTSLTNMNPSLIL